MKGVEGGNMSSECKGSLWLPHRSFRRGERGGVAVADARPWSYEENLVAPSIEVYRDLESQKRYFFSVWSTRENETCRNYFFK